MHRVKFTPRLNSVFYFTDLSEGTYFLVEGVIVFVVIDKIIVSLLIM